MGTIIKNIGLYLSPRLGRKTTYLLCLSVYRADHDNGGIPTGHPVGYSERIVTDVDKEGWYVFKFSPSLDLDSDYYCMVLNQRMSRVIYTDEEQPERVVPENFFNENFVEWTFSDDTNQIYDVYSFSSNYAFTSLEDNNVYSKPLIYGYGYGYAQDDPLEYFNALGIGGDYFGYGISDDFNSSDIVYGYGFESVSLISDKTIQRNFKIYSDFNDIEFIDNGSLSSEDDLYVRINLPPAESNSTILNNRQDFIIADKNQIDVVGNYITLSDSGSRVYSTDTTSLEFTGNESYDIKWNESNIFLSNNDINSASICNPSGNTNLSDVWIASAPYFSGVYFSVNSGSTWYENVQNISLPSGLVRNFSCVKNSSNGTFVIAFDDTNDDERGKVFYAEPTLSQIRNNSVIWELKDSIGLTGVKVNDLHIVDSNEWYVATDSGIWKTVDAGDNWSDISTGIVSGKRYNKIIRKDYYSDSNVFIICGENGIFYLDGVTWTQFGSGISEEIYCVNVITDSNSIDRIWIGTSNGLLRSSEQPLGFAGTIEFEGNNVNDTFYIQGITKNRVTSIVENKDNSSNIIVSQYGSVNISENDGGNFSPVANKLLEKKVKFLLVNPLNNRILYAFTQTTKFADAAVTVLMDCSGSMDSNDPNGIRIDMVQKIVETIKNNADSSNNSAYFQVVRFGYPNSEYKQIASYAESRGLSGEDFSVGGILNVSGGFTSNSDFINNSVLERLRDSNRYLGNVSSINDAIDLISKSLNSGSGKFEYIEKDFEYNVNKVVSSRFSESDKILLIVTDGFNNTIGKTLDYISQSNSEFQKLRGKVYIVAVGQNINYEYLRNLQESKDFVYLYFSPYEDISYNTGELKDIADVILKREGNRRRTGVWKKRIKYDSVRKFTSIQVSFNKPEGTIVKYRARASVNKDTWTDWTEYIEDSQENLISLFGKYIEVEVYIESQFSSYAPEVKDITITYLDPKQSKIIYNSKESDSTKEISEFYVDSIDSKTLNDFTEQEVERDFYFIESGTTNLDFYSKLEEGTKSVVKRKNFEEIKSTDGYFFSTERGAWPSDLQLEIYDITNGISNLTNPISDSSFYAIPSLGRVVFYERSVGNKYGISFTNDNDEYRMAINATNYTSTEKEFKLHDISWMYFDDPRTSEKLRVPLPLVSSQLGEGEVFGQSSPQNIVSSLVNPSVLNLQYINRSSTDFVGGVLSFINGQRINLKTSSSDDDNYRFYPQNIYLEVPSIENEIDANYVFSSKVADGFSISNSGQQYQFDIVFANTSLKSGDSIVLRLGDSSLGSIGLTTYFYQNNLLFDSSEKTVAEMTTTYMVGDSNNISTVPNTSTFESNSNENFEFNDSSFNGFDKPLSPDINFCGNNAVSFEIVCPTLVTVGTSFSCSIIAKDTNGLIDKNFLGNVEVSLSNSNLASIEDSEISFIASDFGVKDSLITVSPTLTGSFRVLVTYNGTTFESNVVLVNSSTQLDRIYWGDLNVSSVFSEGRQSIDFISDYAKNTSKLDFVGISDNVKDIDSSEWQYILHRSSENTSSDFVVFPGFKYQSDNYNGERVVLFQSTTDVPTTLPTNPLNLSSSKSQIEKLLESISDYDYLSFPIHSAYENKSSDSRFQARGFDFNNYRSILTYSPLSDMETFVYGNSTLSRGELAVEVYSEHGSVGNVNEFGNDNFLQDSSRYIIYALIMGKKFGFIANSGGYSSRSGYYMGERSSKVDYPSPSGGSFRGITAVLSPSKTRSSILQAIRERRCYCTTGARIYIDFKGFFGNNQVDMGRRNTNVSFNTGDLTPTSNIKFQCRVIGDKSNIRRIRIVKIEVDNFDSGFNLIDNSQDFGIDTGVLEFTDTNILTENVSGKEYCYFLVATQFDGHQVWSSPIWFDFGRTPGIRDSSTFLSDQIFGITLLENSTDENTFGQVEGAPQRDRGSSGFPNKHLTALVNTPSLLSQSSRNTPYNTETYSSGETPNGLTSPFRINLMASDKQSIFTGLRLNNYSNFNLIYGTHYFRILRDQSEFNASYLIAPNDPDFASNINGSSYLDNYDSQYKFLNQSGDPEPSGARIKRYRSYMNGTVWQYLSSSNFRNGYSLEESTIYASPTEDNEIVRDPYIYRDGSSYYMFYSGFLGNYPIQDKVTYNNSFPPFTPDSSAPNDALDRLEEFSGLASVVSGNDIMVEGLKQRIIFANDSSATVDRSFSKVLTIPNDIGTNTGRKVYFAASPCFVRVAENDNRIYYLGWFYAGSNSTKITLGLFCYRFNNISTIDTSGTNVLCYAFTNKTIDTLSYASRPSSFESLNFIPSDIRAKVSSDSTWPKIHPAYSIPWMWLSVVVHENGTFYAFFNYMNKINETTFTGQDSPATGILFSNDVDHLRFDEFEQIGGEDSISPIQGKMFLHPFKVVSGSNTEWYTLYRNYSGGQISNSFYYSKFNWTPEFTQF